jgi:hypothetical protein
MMNEKSSIDPFTDNILRRMDPKVRNSLSPAQLSGIIEAIRTPAKIYPIDFRGVIPLFFARYFFVLLVGRDRRISMNRAEQFRRSQASWMGAILFVFFLSLPILMVLFLFLYLLKVIWGWDFLPNFHLWDFLF